jgi:HlyD family secretion protein
MNTQVEQTRGNYLSAEAGLEKAKVAVADTERTVKRNRQLAAEGIISQSELDSSITARDSALAGLRAAEAFLIQTRGAYRQAETNLSYTIIRSPVDGVVVSRSVDVGQTVAASFQTPTLFTIAQDLKRMQIETSVDEADIGKIITGQKVSFTVDAYPDKPFSGSVSQIRNAPVTTQNVVTYTVIIAVNNSELKLKPGMTANVSIEVDRKDGILRIPAAALRFHPKDGEERSNRKMAPAGRGQVVYKLTKDMKPQPLKVTTGISDGTFVEAVSGEIQEGDALIVEQTGQKQPPARPRMGGGAMGPRI